MQTTIAQTVALTIWGNAFLRNPASFPHAEFFPAHSTFLFCEYVRFEDFMEKDGVRRRTLYASDPLLWLDRLKEDGFRALRLAHRSSQKQAGGQVPDRMLVGFIGGGGYWMIEAMGPGGSDYWIARWELGDQERPDEKIWRVSYGRLAAGKATRKMKNIKLLKIAEGLMTVLEDIAEFAREHREEGFAKTFERARQCLDSTRPLSEEDRSDMAPKGFLDEPAERLMAAAQRAWVFGGMGSWNDLGFAGQDQVRYEALSEELYRTLRAALIIAANTSAVSLIDD